MIVEFSVKNFRSINELQTLSFAATGLKSSEKYSYVDENNISICKNMQLFNTIGIYGANASGKSNLIKAFYYFIKAITNQPSAVSNLSSLCQPFLYQKEIEATESFFQIVIVVNDTKYRYGFTIKKNHNTNLVNDESIRSDEIITSEWLFADKAKNMSALFERKNMRMIKVALQNKSKIPESIPFKHTFFLTHAAAFDTTGDCFILSNYLRGNVVSNFSASQSKFRWMSIDYLNDIKLKGKFKDILSAFNLKYDDIFLDEDTEISRSYVFPQEKITLSKKYKVDNNDLNVNLNLKQHESSGTQKLFDLAGLLLRAFGLPQSAFIILDEIDSNFHPSLLIKLISLFNDSDVNLSNSQLLFTSHDTNLMSPSLMRRDQFYLTEKNENNSTRLYSLADLRGIKNDADFAKQYLAGYYGAVPILEKYYTT